MSDDTPVPGDIRALRVVKNILNVVIYGLIALMVIAVIIVIVVLQSGDAATVPSWLTINNLPYAVGIIVIAVIINALVKYNLNKKVDAFEDDE